MPLPAAGIQWPPLDVATYHDRQQAWQAWWAGDEHMLKDAAQRHGGDGQRRRFWQRRATGDKTTVTHALHAPLASDIALVSADLLFGEAVTLEMPTGEPGGQAARNKAQERLDDLRDELGLDNLLLEAAEVSAAVGSVYLRPVWDKTVADTPLSTIVPGNKAVPDFRYGRLAAVTFFEEILYDDPETRTQAVWRHLERHEPGLILHGLYRGDWFQLGDRMPLTALSETAGFTDEIKLDQPFLLPSYIPNALPNRRFPIESRSLGRSDYDGSESLLDALDETWTSWLRDIRAGQARVLADTSLLTPVANVAGSPRGIDLDQELFTMVNMADREDKPIEPIQFQIRVQEHQETVTALTNAIVSGAGYSPQTFGLAITGEAESGTALRMRENKTFRTQGRKQRYCEPAVEHHMQMLLYIDSAPEAFGRPTPVMRPELAWPELIDDPAGRATWIGLLKSAGAISTRTAIQLAQPELSGDDLELEVQRVLDEGGMNLDPPEPGQPVTLTDPATGQPADPNALPPPPPGSNPGTPPLPTVPPSDRN